MSGRIIERISYIAYSRDYCIINLHVITTLLLVSLLTYSVTLAFIAFIPNYLSKIFDFF